MTDLSVTNIPSITDATFAEQWFVIGKFGKPFGVDGWLHVQSFTTQPTDLFLSPWFYHHHNSALALTCTDHCPHGSHFVCLTTLATERTAASSLVNTLILTPRDQLTNTDANGIYWQDLEGMTVANIDGFIFGTIAFMREGTGFDLMMITTPDQRQIVLPYDTTRIKEIDLSQRLLTINWHPDDV